MVRLRSSLAFVENGLSVLKLKRDRLAEELNSLLRDMALRDEAEKQLMLIYDDFKAALALLDYSKTHSLAYSVGEMSVVVKEHNIMNVPVPVVRITGKPSTVVIREPALFQVAEKLEKLIDRWFEVARIEASVERIAHELTLVNRKINSIEKVVIPSYVKQIKYIEDFISDEELEDFTRIKHTKTTSQEKIQ